MCRLVLHFLKITLFVGLVAGILGFSLTVLAFILYVGLESIVPEYTGYYAYHWIALFSIGISLCIVWLLNRKRNSLKKYADRDGMLIWDISWNIVAVSLSFFFLSISWASIKRFINRDRDPRINSISELLDKAGELEGKTMTMSPELFDTAAINAEINNMLKNDSFMWKPFVSQAEGFSAEYPNYKILEKEEFIGTVPGRYKLKTYYTGTNRAIDYNNLYSISIVPIPDEYSVLAFMDVVKEYLLEENYGKLIKEGDYKGMGFIGRVMQLSKKDGEEVLTVRVVANKGSVYIITVATDTGNVNNEYLTYFFESVQLF